MLCLDMTFFCASSANRQEADSKSRTVAKQCGPANQHMHLDESSASLVRNSGPPERMVDPSRNSFANRGMPDQDRLQSPTEAKLE